MNTASVTVAKMEAAAALTSGLALLKVAFVIGFRPIWLREREEKGRVSKSE
jgi:hypothetical protein